MEEETQEIQLDQRGDEYSGYGYGWKACIRACYTQYEENEADTCTCTQIRCLPQIPAEYKKIYQCTP